MNDKQLKEILKQKFDNFEVELPADDWSMIEGRITRKKARVVPMIWVAAASIALLVGAFFMFDNSQEQPLMATSSPVQVKTPAEPLPIAKPAEVSETHTQHPTHSQPISTPKSTKSIRKQPNLTIPALTEITEPVAKNEIAVVETTEVATAPNPSQEDMTANTTTKKELTIEEAEALMREQHNATYNANDPMIARHLPEAEGWSIGASAGLNPSLSSILENPDILLASSDENDGAPMHMKSFTNIKADHELPVSVGLSVSKDIIPRLSVVTGVNYTLVRSKFSTIGANDLVTQAEYQNLHYIGIPVQLSYRFLETRLINLYASAGGAGEKGVLMQTTYRTYDENERPTKTEYAKSGIKGFQWSLTATAGISINIIDALGIYFEPGFTWYIPSASQPTSIRTEKPYNLSLAAGLRFKFR